MGNTLSASTRFCRGNADEVLEIIDERIELQHSEYMNIMEHYLRFRGTLKEKVANSYSPSDIMQRIVVSTNVEKAIVAEWTKINMG